MGVKHRNAAKSAAEFVTATDPRCQLALASLSVCIIQHNAGARRPPRTQEEHAAGASDHSWPVTPRTDDHVNGLSTLSFATIVSLCGRGVTAGDKSYRGEIPPDVAGQCSCPWSEVATRVDDLFLLSEKIKSGPKVPQTGVRGSEMSRCPTPEILKEQLAAPGPVAKQGQVTN